MSAPEVFYFNVFSDLVPGIIHEINNPLGALIMNISILKDDFNTGQMEEINEDLFDTVSDMENALSKIKEYVQAVSLCMSKENFRNYSNMSITKLFQYAELLIRKKTKYEITINKKFPPQQHFFSYIKPAVVIFSILYAIDQILAKRQSDILDVFVEEKENKKVYLRLNIASSGYSPDAGFLEILKNENFSCVFSQEYIEFTFPSPDTD